MSSEIRVRQAPTAEQFAVLIVAVGYELRSRHVAEKYHSRAARGVALAFPSPGEHSFDENMARLSELGFEIQPIDDHLANRLSSLLESLDDGHRHIGIDVSSFTKFHLAEIVETLAERADETLTVDFLYAPASSEGWKARGGPIRVAEPVHPAFASWTDDPSWPLTAIIGLGVEENLALGVAEHLDVSAVYAYSPAGSDSGFDAMGMHANSAFFLADYVVRSSSYDLLAPFELFTRLESLVYGLRPESRVAIVPLGPKIFALCALLATIVSDRATTVWRFSEGPGSETTDVAPAGPVVSLRVEFGSRAPE